MPTIFHTSSMHEVTVWQICLNRNFEILAEKYHIQPSQATSLCCAYHATSGQPPRPNANPRPPPPKPRPSPFHLPVLPQQAVSGCPLVPRPHLATLRSSQKCDASHSSPFIFPSCPLFSPTIAAVFRSTFLPKLHRRQLLQLPKVQKYGSRDPHSGTPLSRVG